MPSTTDPATATATDLDTATPDGGAAPTGAAIGLDASTGVEGAAAGAEPSPAGGPPGALERAGRGAQRVVDAIAARADLDPVAERLTRLRARVPERVVAVLQGEWLGHSLHPAVTDLPVGFWTSGWILDLVGGEERRPAADLLIGAGVACALPTVATGWSELLAMDDRRHRRVAVAHAGSNALATSLFAASFAARRTGARRAGVLLGHLGAGAATFGGLLGGHLAFSSG